MTIWHNILASLGRTSPEGFTLDIESSMILIAILCLMAAQADAAPARAACCSARAHAAALRAVTRALFRVANLLLLYAAIIGNSSLIQIYLWYTLAFIVVGFAAAILDMLLGIKHEECWCVPDFISEVVFLFVLSQCLPLVDMYRKQISELVQVKYSD